MNYETNRISVMEVYKRVMSQAKMWRDSARDKSNGRTESNREVCEALARELYAVAANLENTEEVNPTKDATILQFVRLVVPGGSFSDEQFDTIEDARAYKQNHLDGLPDSQSMSEENREYWKKVGATMRIFDVKRTEQIEEIN